MHPIFGKRSWGASFVGGPFAWAFCEGRSLRADFTWICLFCLLFGFPACMPPQPEAFEGDELNAAHPEVRRILDFQDRRQADSLYPYLESQDPNLRFAAARALASVRAETAVPHLLPLLKDEVLEVRTAAAYALGQTGSSEALPALVKAFVRGDTLRHFAAFHAALLEAVGKCGDEKHLKYLATIQTYRPDDTLLLEGQARGIYRYALRGMVLPEGTECMVRFLGPEYPPGVRLMAANYLHRARGLKLDEHVEALLYALTDPNPYIRQCIASALAKTKTEEALKALRAVLENDVDYRVRCSTLRALSHFDYEQAFPLAYIGLHDANPRVAECAAGYFYEQGNKDDAKFYWRFARDSLPANAAKWRLYAAAERHLPYFFGTSHGRILWELKTAFGVSEDPYLRAAVIQAMGAFYKNYREVYHLAKADPHPVVRTAGIRALGECMQVKRFDRAFRPNPDRVRREVSAYLAEALRSGDVGMMTEAANILADESLFFKETFADSLHLLENALEGLHIPREIETRYALEKALAHLQGKKPPAVEPPPFNHPIDWEALQRLGDQPQVVLYTTKGEIELELWPRLAPGSVLNFCQLTESGFYNSKVFHRVVPNFVVQGGCPRGDGYGGLDYSIRSELPRLYYDAEGFVGMASAGPDTECTQFFITHSPTPHLDGKYTIFGRVIKGMEAVHAMAVGDVINKAVLVLGQQHTRR